MSGGHVHYVIVEGGRHQVWSRHRGCRSLFDDLLAGPDGAVAFVREQEGGTPDFWMNALWWNGLVLIDLPRRRLMVYNDRMDWSIPELRAWLRLMRRRWNRWEVTWAPRGLFEAMEYLGLPYATVPDLDRPAAPLRRQWAMPPTEDDDLGFVARCLIATRGERLSFGGMWTCGLDEPLLAGPEALLAEQEEALPFAALDAVPWNGAYVDAPARRLDWWAIDCPLDLRELERRWAGWTLTDHGDAYEKVAALIGPELVIDVVP